VSARVILAIVVVLALLALGAIVLWPFIGRRQAGPGPGGAPQTTSDWYELAFTTPVYPDRRENHKGGLDEKLVALIDTSRRTLDVAAYDFDLQNVAQAMARAKQRGVTVRMVTDTDTIENTRDAEIQAALKTVRDAGIPIVDDQRRPIMHHKFAVVDNAVVLTGSWNFTAGDTYRLNNHAIILRSPEIAANFTNEFEKMHVRRQFGPTKPKDIPNPVVNIGGARVETIFASEHDPSGRIVEVIRGARQRVDFLAFSFTHDGIGSAMLDRAKGGVKVRGVFENTGSETRFSEFGRMKEAKLEVYQDGNPYVMHHKVIVVDGRYTVFGSYNFSANASDDNDENCLIVDDPKLAAAFLAEVDRMVALAKNPPQRR
jgi:phosphatidylserine/phosphatidylglycerophosphate/cardiolipin synthase-like enzyme